MKNVSKQGLVFAIATLTQSVNAKTGQVQKFYYGEVVDGNRARLGLTIGENQVQSLLKQVYGEGHDKTANALVGRKIAGNAKGFEDRTDADNNVVPAAGMFVVDSYFDKEGVAVPLAKPSLIAGGLLTYVGEFNEMLHEMLDFGSLPVETDKPNVAAIATPAIDTVAAPKAAILAEGDLA